MQMHTQVEVHMLEKRVCETTVILYGKRKPGEDSSQRKPERSTPSKLIYRLLVGNHEEPSKASLLSKGLE